MRWRPHRLSETAYARPACVSGRCRDHDVGAYSTSTVGHTRSRREFKAKNSDEDAPKTS
ncbi:uncharacterized protein STEHIDRAFT_130993 [Stereum hirsutum FP-91666 SS1]|uniref:uncharacterized protein n=1 Tax=Stereum hirsutum (strain FP-91666) TaxID=721885 RepID=UPI000440DC8B|nr:uncharacterized protein STEHIDRAFT_130993 [Stereum hirsutum FP-91666 SS1]EIM87676.1 hypothetical protein STEHIDRAFT_130993 [Stereum hirsutum FP-91666 SS1]